MRVVSVRTGQSTFKSPTVDGADPRCQVQWILSWFSAGSKRMPVDEAEVGIWDVLSPGKRVADVPNLGGFRYSWAAALPLNAGAGLLGFQDPADSQAILTL